MLSAVLQKRQISNLVTNHGCLIWTLIDLLAYQTGSAQVVSMGSSMYSKEKKRTKSCGVPFISGYSQWTWVKWRKSVKVSTSGTTSTHLCEELLRWIGCHPANRGILFGPTSVSECSMSARFVLALSSSIRSLLQRPKWPCAWVGMTRDPQRERRRLQDLRRGVQPSRIVEGCSLTLAGKHEGLEVTDTMHFSPFTSKPLTSQWPSSPNEKSPQTC